MAEVRQKHGRLCADVSRSIGLAGVERLRIHSPHLIGLVHVRLGKLTLDLGPIAHHVQLEGFVRRRRLARSVALTLARILVDRGDLGAAHRVLFLHQVLVSVEERVRYAVLLPSLLVLAAQLLSDGGSDGLELELVLALDLLPQSVLRDSRNVLRKI